MTNQPANPAPRPTSRSIPAPGTRSPHPATPASVVISKAVNPSQLLNELQTQYGVTGAVQKQGAQYRLTVHQRNGATDAQIQTVIAMHQPAAVPASAQANLQNWPRLTDAQKDAVMLTALKKVYGMT